MKIVLTGSTGYIGRRLKARLLEDEGVRLRLFVRNAKKLGEVTRSEIEVVEGDTFDRGALRRAVEGIDVAYYLIHSMGAGRKFEELDRVSAENFREACIEAGVERIIYLGGLGVKESASRHLLSRIETGEILSARPDRIRTIWFRAGIIVGSGSASFEILKHLVQKLPVMVTPRWVGTKTEPVFVTDVLNYLLQAKDLPLKENLVVDLGAGQMTFRDMMLRTARVMGLRRLMIPVPVLTPKLSSYWLILFTPVPYSVAAALIEGLKSETVLQNDNAAKYFPDIVPTPFEEAVRRALIKVETNQVISRWCDSTAREVQDVSISEKPERALYKDTKRYGFGSLDPHLVFLSIKSIGGRRGWFACDFLWEMRGLIDKLLGGYGINRGRRDEDDLRVGDKVDFWKVADLGEDKLLLLEAQMKVPGKAWLEFRIEDNLLVQTAYYYPKGLWGRLYWYLTMPFHFFVFRDLARGIIRRAERWE